ncbi:MAG: hypothetical protein HY659_07755, partial [Rhizobiales bacterium]|nr:hypothetical protein [Hyphomicrobiales bacterium]
MNTPTVSQSKDLERAGALLRIGDMAGAARACKAILETDEENFGALHMLGVIEAQSGRLSNGERLLHDAVRLN